VNLTVTSSPPQLLVATSLVSVGADGGTTQPLTGSVTIQNSGGGTLGIGSVSCEASWCSDSGVPGSLAGGASAAISVAVDPTQLTAGFFRTQIDIVTSAGKGAVPVTALISANSTITLAPVGTQFSMPAGSAPGNPNGSFLVTVTNTSPVSFTAAVLPGAPWLVLGTVSGSSSATQPGSVAFSISASAAGALAPGSYYGRIEITSSGVQNSPIDFEVVLNVTLAGGPQAPDPEPAGLLYITAAGGTLPPQTVTVYSGSPTLLTFQAAAASGSAGWLSVSPGVGTADAASPGVTTVSVNAASLQPGVYQGSVNYSLSASALRTVNVVLIVTASAAAPQALSAGGTPDNAAPRASTCTPNTLVPVDTGLVSNFSAYVAWPTPLTIQLPNDCGSPVTNGQVVATFSNGDPPLPLALADSSLGTYSGTWTPRKAVSQMTITVQASAPGYPAATAEISGTSVPNSAPVLTPHGTLHSFNPLVGAALAPGTIIQTYGQNLASETSQPATIPLPTMVNGTSVLVGGETAPLYYVSAGQINAQLPFDLDPTKQYQIIVLANGALTTPDTVQLSAATPGFAAFPDSTLIAQHADGSLVSATSPARSGEYLVAYLAGMGGTNATPASGAASPGSPLAVPVATPVLTINGTQYPIAFAGLTPGLVGLYQLNFQVPSGLPAGDLTVVLTQNGQPTNQTVLPYQP
jgi:uncharacterized protein (TIGR03437 family)